MVCPERVAWRLLRLYCLWCLWRLWSLWRLWRRIGMCGCTRPLLDCTNRQHFWQGCGIGKLPRFALITIAGRSHYQRSRFHRSIDGLPEFHSVRAGHHGNIDDLGMPVDGSIDRPYKGLDCPIVILGAFGMAIGPHSRAGCDRRRNRCHRCAVQNAMVAVAAGRRGGRARVDNGDGGSTTVGDPRGGSHIHVQRQARPADGLIAGIVGFIVANLDHGGFPLTADSEVANCVEQARCVQSQWNHHRERQSLYPIDDSPHHWRIHFPSGDSNEREDQHTPRHQQCQPQGSECG